MSGAIISPCGKFRYQLWRDWDSAKPLLVFVMLNPSTADASADDPTVRRCIGFAKRLDYGSILIVNLYAYRTKSPQELRDAGSPVGEDCDLFIWEAVSRAGGVICAWGANARKDRRADEVMQSIRSVRPDISLTALGLTDDGIPKHPLYLPSNSPLLSL